jgi:DNA uptake protein ComE-like DNA-binding protein
MALPAKPKLEIWTRRQRRTLLGFCVILLIFLGIERWRKPVTLADPAMGSSARSSKIRDRLDPNTADAAALSAIPNLGENRAQDIVSYRETFAGQHPGVVPFKRSADLMRVKGIGPSMAADLEPFLIFGK